MLVLGIESTAHTFGIGIIDCSKKKVLFNQKIQFKNDVGMDLRKLSDFHTQNFDKVLILAKKFLKTINKTFSNIDLISFSQGPGIGNSLKIGSLVAKTLSLKYKIKIVGVNHIKAHLEIAKMQTNFKDPMFLFVSGVNTQIIAKDEFLKYKIYSQTQDIGLGNLIDSFARVAKLDFPGGPIIEKLAKKSNNYLELPFCVKGMNFSLAGMYSNLKKKLDDGTKIEDLCYSLEETLFSMVLEVVLRAIFYTKKKEFLIVGGVGCNQRLNNMAKKMCLIENIEFATFPIEFAADNGAMIAWCGFLKKDKASYNIKNLKPMPYINIENDL